MDRISKRNMHPWLTRFAQATALSAVLAIGITWAGSIADHPIDTAITAGMTSPACAEPSYGSRFAAVGIAAEQRPLPVLFSLSRNVLRRNG